LIIHLTGYLSARHSGESGDGGITVADGQAVVGQLWHELGDAPS
jgi:hypothetical protein